MCLTQTGLTGTNAACVVGRYELMASIDKDRDSHIDFAEFATRFRVVFTQIESSDLAADAGTPKALPRLVSWRTIKANARSTSRARCELSCCVLHVHLRADHRSPHGQVQRHRRYSRGQGGR